eukprot:5501371-Amphidinium_carterae.2
MLRWEGASSRTAGSDKGFESPPKMRERIATLVLLLVHKTHLVPLAHGATHVGSCGSGARSYRVDCMGIKQHQER